MNSLLERVASKCFSRRNRVLFIILSGLLVAHTISSLQVYRSNLVLHEKCTILNDLGYLVVPNQIVMETLTHFSYAFFGGLFFTLSVGAGITVFSFLLAWIWVNFLNGERSYLYVFFILFAAFAVITSLKGPDGFVIAYFILIPVVVFFLTKRLLPPTEETNYLFEIGLHLIPIGILAVFWATQMSEDMFLDLRDHFLLSNSFGYQVNTFYYDYTLYPAEVFKSINQKQIKTLDVAGVTHPGLKVALKKKLNRYGYVDIKGRVQADVSIYQEKNSLTFKHDNTVVLNVSNKDFFKNVKKSLIQISDTCDRYKSFRQLTSYSLLVGFPIVLYILFFSGLYFISHFFFREQVASMSVSICSLAVGLLMWIPIYQSSQSDTKIGDLEKMLHSDTGQVRILALKHIGDKKLDITDYLSFESLLKSDSLPEVYWTLRALGFSKHPDVRNYILPFLDSPHTNIVCQAYYALGRLKDKSIVKDIIFRIKQSDHWYEQFYGYNSLRRLGWKQSLLK